MGQISINATGAVVLSNPCGVSFNDTEVSCTYATGTHGNVMFTVSSLTPFTTITLTNIGGSSGWVSGNLCNFQVTPAPQILNCPKVYMNKACYATFSQTTANSLFGGDDCNTPATVGGVPCNASNVTIEMINLLPFGCHFNTDGTLVYPGGTLPFDSNNNYFYRLRSVANPNIVSPIYRVDFGIQPKIKTILHNIWINSNEGQHYTSGSYNTLSNNKSQYNTSNSGDCSAFVQAIGGALSGNNVIVQDITSPQNQFYTIAQNGNVVTRPGVVDTSVPYGQYNLTIKISSLSNPTIFTTGTVAFNPIYANKMGGLKAVEDKNLNVKIYPNPSKDAFTLSFGKTIENATVEIYNLIGQMITTNQVTNVSEQVLPELSKGIYFVKIMAGEQSVVKQIMKE